MNTEGEPPGVGLMALAAIVAIAAIALTLSSAGCLVEEEGPAPAGATVPADRRDTRLVVDGLVATPINWTLQRVVDLGLVDFRATFVNSVGTTYSSNYTGVRVHAILDAAAACATAETLEVEASDGYKAQIYLSDVTDDSYIALKEEGRWLNLSDAGAMRFVDTRMSSVYWVKRVVALHLERSASLSLSGLEWYEPASYVTAAQLHARANVTVTWKEGTKTRTAMGLDMWDVREWLNITGAFLDLIGPGQQVVTVNASSMFDPTPPVELKCYLAVDSKGRFVLVANGSAVATGFTELRPLNGIDIHGAVRSALMATMGDLDELPQRDVRMNGQNRSGSSLGDVLGLAGAEPGATSVLIGPGNGTTIEIPMADVSDYTLVEAEDPRDDALFPILDLILVHGDSESELGWFVVSWADVRSE